MKKLFAFAAICSATFFHHAFAQQASKENSYGDASSIAQLDNSFTKNESFDVDNSKALRSFTKIYGDAPGAEWFQTKEKGLVCQFTRKNLKERAFFNKGGNWLFTVTGFGEKHLPADVRDMVKRNYYNYDLGYTYQIGLPDNRLIYLVSVHNEKSIKLIRIEGDEMDEIQDLQNN